AAEEVLGVRFGDLRGRWVQEALAMRLHPLRDALLSVLDSHDPKSRGELLLQNGQGGPLPIGLSTNLLTHEGKVTGVVAVFQDLTAVREMEQRALRNQTLAEVGSLAAVIAHELRNGLSPISGSIEMLQRELKLEGEHGQLMGVIMTECIRLIRFVTDLLAYARERALVRATRWRWIRARTAWPCSTSPATSRWRSRATASSCARCGSTWRGTRSTPSTARARWWCAGTSGTPST
ncbi:MAG: hypothetical protein E6K80_05315, partial [Candidatus Eisenbacteria bacterium]